VLRFLKQLVCKHDRITNERDYVICIDCGKILVPAQSTLLEKIIRFILGDDNTPRMGF
jgi:hypothetical protein